MENFKKNNHIHLLAVDALIEKFGFTPRYILGVVSGEKYVSNKGAQVIRNEYEKFCGMVSRVTEVFVNDFEPIVSHKTVDIVDQKVLEERELVLEEEVFEFGIFN